MTDTDIRIEAFRITLEAYKVKKDFIEQHIHGTVSFYEALITEAEVLFKYLKGPEEKK